MWNACGPGASSDTVSPILTPSGVCVSSAVPTFFPREFAKSAFAVVAAFWATRTADERNRTPRPDIKLFMALTPPPVFEFDDYRPGSALVQVCTSKFLTAARQ